jgi:hypothetical protein
MGAQGGGCGAFNSTAPAPDVTGQWAITYGDGLNIKVTIGGAVYSQTLPASGGTFVVNHQGQPFTFNLDCSRPEVVCPSEVWPASVSIDQRDATYQHRMWVKIPTQTCSGQTVAPKASECGQGTPNPDCKPVCTGEVTTSSVDTFGLIDDAGDSFNLLLGGGFATNGINCAMLGLSVASADLVTTKSGTEWDATEMRNGTVTTGYAGGCVWAGPVDAQGKPDALVLGATLELSTTFTGERH